MEQWDPAEDEIDWLTGEFTYKRDKERHRFENEKSEVLF